MKTFFINTIILLGVVSCSYLIESDNSKTNATIIEAKNTLPLNQIYCSKPSFSSVSKNGKFQKKAIQYPGLIAEKIVQNYMIEMWNNPDYFVSNPRIQIFIKDGPNVRYFENVSTDLSQAHSHFGESLSTFLKSERSQKNLSQLKSDAIKLRQSDPLTTITFSKFIKDNIQDFIRNDTLKNHFLKGDDALAPYESYHPLDINVTSNVHIEAHSDPNFSGKFTSSKVNDLNLKCNFNLELFQNFTSSLVDLAPLNSYYFGKIIDKDSFYVVATSGQVSKPVTLDQTTGLIKGTPSITPTPFCYYENENKNDNNKFLFAISTEGRDPAQHLSHFIDYGFFEAESLTDIIGHMKFTRHLFLKNPDRILVESNRAREEQLTFFYTMNIPLYHMDKIGDTLFYGTFPTKGQQSFILDERSGAQIACP